MNNRMEAKLSRRHVLRGVSGLALGLPYLLGREGTSHAQTAVPERLITAYFGNGMPKQLTANGYTGVLEPLAPFAEKLTMIRGIDTHAQASGPGHDAGSHAFCCALNSGGDNTNKQGPSLDWVVKEHFKPETAFDTVSAGVFSGKQGGKRVRWIHSWRGAKQPNEPFSNPLRLFEGLFGGGNAASPNTVDTGAALARFEARTSVLDAVRSEYQSLLSPASGYPASAKAIIGDHLDLVRGLERRVLDLGAMGAAEACQMPDSPEDSEAKRGNLAGYMRHWQNLWPVMADIYVAGLRCDLFRFGNVLVTNGGDEFSHRVGNDSAEDIHGDWFHAYGRHKQGVDTVIDWEWQQLAYFLQQLDDPAFLDANGKTILDNATTFLGTELADLPHSHDDLTFFVAGAQGRFKGGVQQFNGRSDVDMYETIIKSFDFEQSFGDQRHSSGELGILA